LILKRDEREITHPGRYGVVGGKLEWKDLPIEKPDNINGDVLDYNDAIERLIVREAKEESGLDIFDDIKYVNSKAFIRPDEVPAILVKFAVKYKSGEVVLEKGGFTDYAWVNPEEVKEYPCIDGIPEEIQQAIKLWES
jgi:8-oxo-dGTP pyrophosphatase MutT (NUDIX family)